jgi:hypothetical protein
MLSCITIKRMNMVSVFHAAIFLQVWNQNCLRYFRLSYLCYMSISLILPRLFVLILVYKPKAAKYAALIFVIFTILFVFSYIHIISSAFWSQTSLNYVNVLGWQQTIRRCQTLQNVKSEPKEVSFLSMIFKDIVSCWDYVASVVEEWMDMQHLSNDIDKKNSPSQCHAFPPNISHGRVRN